MWYRLLCGFWDGHRHTDSAEGSGVAQETVYGKVDKGSGDFSNVLFVSKCLRFAAPTRKFVLHMYKTSTALTQTPPPSDDKHISAEGASLSRRLEWGGWCTCSWAGGRSHLQSLFLISPPPRGANISISMRRRREGEPPPMSDFAPRREGRRENRRRHFPYFWSEGSSCPGGFFRGLLRRGDGGGGGS